MIKGYLIITFRRLSLFIVDVDDIELSSVDVVGIELIIEDIVGP